MVFAPYPIELPEAQAANNAGLAYGAAKGAFLLLLGSEFSSPPLLPEQYAKVAIAFLGVSTMVFATLTAFREWKAEHALVEWSGQTAAKEHTPTTARAKWLAEWTSYCFAAAVYGKMTQALFIMDMKITALKISKIALGLSLGLILVYASPYPHAPIDWKFALGFSVFMSSMAVNLPLFLNNSFLPETASKSRDLLQESVETHTRERRLHTPIVISVPTPLMAAQEEAL